MSRLAQPVNMTSTTDQPDRFIVGGNWRIIQYGQNFGANAWFPEGNGVARHRDVVLMELEALRQVGIQLVRVGLLDDGRTLLDDDARVVGYDDIFRNDVRLFLELAQAARMQVEFFLLDFLVAAKPLRTGDVLMQGRPQLFLDQSRRRQFISDFLRPFLREFGNHPTLFGLDIINEPEWLISQDEGGGWEFVSHADRQAQEPLPARQVKEFISECIATIRALAPTQLVTVGISGVLIPLIADLDLDYFAPHHYPWMGDFRNILDALPEGKPWLLEEYPTHNAPMSLTDYLDSVWEMGGSGALMWNLTPGIDEYTFPHERQEAIWAELRNWIAS
ncbi:MAG: hypothetical protein NZ823_01705 [Blastocatellia bacterium]|nr:hypothetical protein [Blastocatellia bacterium]